MYLNNKVIFHVNYINKKIDLSTNFKAFCFNAFFQRRHGTTLLTLDTSRPLIIFFSVLKNVKKKLLKCFTGPLKKIKKVRFEIEKNNEIKNIIYL
jgi:hypothetical protein